MVVVGRAGPCERGRGTPTRWVRGSVVPVLNRLDLRSVHGPVGPHLPRPTDAHDAPLETVREILHLVRTHGDAAVRELTERFDGVTRESLRVSEEEIAQACDATPLDVIDALRIAADRIRGFHEAQLHPETIYDDLGHIRSFARPVDRVGCYVPGGRAAYPSTVLMTAIPALVAGVGEVAVCVPPSRESNGISEVTLAACAIAGVTEVYAMGGAQAIGAFAYGTESVPAVDVICGPGNSYVALAKREVAGAVGIASSYAGPSEIIVVADDSVPTTFAAIDVLVQAEHGPDGLAWLITWDESVLNEVCEEVERLTSASPRRELIESTLRRSGHAVLCRDAEQAIEVANQIAPEHLQLMVADPESLVPLVRNAGAIFCGAWSPASLGDYLAGPSHVLPTDGTARFGSALTVSDFQKHHHVITFDEEAFRELAPALETIAGAEGLQAHADSARLRRES